MPHKPFVAKLVEENALADDIYSVFRSDKEIIERKAAELAERGRSGAEIRKVLGEDILKLKLKVLQMAQEKAGVAATAVAKAREKWDRESNKDAATTALKLRRLELKYGFLDKEELQKAITDELSRDIHDPEEVQILFRAAEEKGVKKVWLNERRNELKRVRYDEPWLQGESKSAQEIVERYGGVELGELPYTMQGLNADGVQIENHQRAEIDSVLNLSRGENSG